MEDASVFHNNKYTDFFYAKVQEYEDKDSTKVDICGVPMEETGQNMILMLAIVPGIPESSYNIQLIFNAVGVNQLPYILSADLKMLMPCFGLMSCSSSHPCLFCPRKRVKGEWQEVEVQLRTFASLKEQHRWWVAAGSKYTTKWTSSFQSTVGPILVEADGEAITTSVLEKVGMPTVHLLLAVNDILRPHVVEFFGS